MRHGLMANIMLGVVISMGLINFAAQFFIKGYTPDPLITGAFLGIAGLILGTKGLGKDKEDSK